MSSPGATHKSKTRSVIAHHLILTLYGHWGVNDPRGSGSTDFIDPKFEPLGPIHHGRKPAQQQPSRDKLRVYHREHAELLNFPVIWIDDAKRQALATAFGEVVRQRNYTCYACAILSNHAHLVIRIHRDRANTMMELLMNASRLRLRNDNDFPDIGHDHPVYSSRPYVVFLYTPADVRGRIAYVQNNPVKESLGPQAYDDFVKDYDDWPLHKRAKK